MEIAVLEPREVLRRGLAAMLEKLEGINRLECHRSLDELLAHSVNGHTWKPEVVIASYPSAEEVRTTFPSARVLEVIDSAEPGDLAVVAKARADGYLMLSDITEDILGNALRAVRRGELPIPLPVANYLIERARVGDSPTPRIQPYFSPREHDVIALLLDGMSNMQIARRLGISLHSAKRHVSAVLHKVNSPSRAHFVAWMLREE
ncbi:MAG TPA: response regulator transcription factor [Umezawaea sp.]|nr:response regulator transcription factor [Umezawaea sp.]